MKDNNRKIIFWLISGCFLIFTMVIVGGITRLTGSGLSITEWKIVTGTFPPLNENQWQHEFYDYQQSPQYKLINSSFTVEDFKGIYWWEYIHRLLGRLIGIIFIVPFIYFLKKKWIDKNLLPKLIIIFCLGGLQGIVGWLMVATGLQYEPHVSHFALAAHLIMAFITFGFTFWVILEITPHEKNKQNNLTITLRKISYWILILVTLQIIYGAFVAGLKAGHIYNTFPKMGDEWVAESVPFGIQTEGISSLFNNISVVQFIHRTIAWLLALTIIFIWYFTKKKNNVSDKSLLITRQKKALNFLVIAVIVQFLLGVFTLIYNVPIALGVLHQSGAFFLFSVVIYLMHCVKKFDDLKI